MHYFYRLWAGWVGPDRDNVDCEAVKHAAIIHGLSN